MLSLARFIFDSLGSIALDTSCGQVGLIISTTMFYWDDVIDLGCVLPAVATYPPISTKYL
jgi:hypothetical protein